MLPVPVCVGITKIAARSIMQVMHRIRYSLLAMVTIWHAMMQDNR